MLVDPFDPFGDPPFVLVPLQHDSEVKDCLGIGDKVSENFPLLHNLVDGHAGSSLLGIDVCQAYLTNGLVIMKPGPRAHAGHEILACALLGLDEVHCVSVTCKSYKRLPNN